MFQSIKDKSSTALRVYPRKSRLAIFLVIASILAFSPLIEWAFQLFIGTIPGTSYSIPYWIMFTAYVGALLLVILIVMEDAFYMREAVQKHTLRKLAAKRRAAKRRYSHS